ncbi:MAG: malate synthase A [Gemmatimonadaceae bacterium]
MPIDTSRRFVSALAAKPADAEPVTVGGPRRARYDEVLTRDALAFLGALERRFAGAIEELLAARHARRARWGDGEQLNFRADTRGIREGSWQVADAPKDLTRRLVEITGPTDRKMVINALNSGADVFMADFEDATSPTWDNLVQGQINVRDAVRREITHDDPASGKSYRLGDKLATLVVRPRGLHLTERHVTLGGRPIHASLFDFGLAFFHNAAELIERGSGPYYYLPKLESHREAALWNEVFLAAQDALGVPRGSVRATVLIETLPAAFEMDEILFALREHAAGLNCGRWDYIFSHIKARQHDPNAIFPDRSQVGMTQPFMRAYTQLAIRACHARGAFAMGGMSAFIPSRDPEANEKAFAQVRADKDREAGDGHDGTWVAHPGLVDVARQAFAARLASGSANQLDVMRSDYSASAAQLLEVPKGERTEAGLRHNARVGIQYIEAWLRGVGAVPLYNLMEDAATAEISRSQVWQWLRWNVALDDGRRVTPELVEQAIEDEMGVIANEVGDERMTNGRFDEARELFAGLVFAQEIPEFLTTVAYDCLDVADSNT